MNAPAELQNALQQLLGDARLSAETLPGTDIRLWLVDPSNMDRSFSPEETRRILEEPPYWSFCWASGLVLARWLAERPEWPARPRWWLATSTRWPSSPAAPMPR